MNNTLFNLPFSVIYCILVCIRAWFLKLSILTNTDEISYSQIDMEEGYSTNKLPLFKGIKYDYWKEHMIAHFKSIHIDLWDVVEHGNYVPLDDQLNEVSRTSWIDAQRQRFMLNSKARNTLLCTLSKEEYTKVHNYKSANQMWETLALMDEGSSQVKHNKLSLLSHKYELFTMEDGKDIQAMFGCFQTILNELCCLNKKFDNYDNMDKILRSLCKKWRP